MVQSLAKVLCMFIGLSRSRGFGFITFKQAESVDDVQKDRPHNIDGRDVETKRAMPREVSAQNKISARMNCIA